MRGKKAESVTRAEYEALRDRLEDVEDILHMRAIEAKSDPRNLLPIEMVDRMIAGEHPIHVWREHRGLRLNALARKAGIPASYVSEIENGKKPGSVAAYRALADALGVSLDDLVA